MITIGSGMLSNAAPSSAAVVVARRRQSTSKRGANDLRWTLCSCAIRLQDFTLALDHSPCMDAPPAAKRLRSRSTSYNEREPCRSLISLPVELVTYILDQVEDFRDLLALSKTCRALYRPCSLRALVARFGRGRGLDSQLYCLNPSYLVGIGLWPFAILDAHWVDHERDVALKVVEFGPNALKETPNLLGSHLTFFWTDDGVSLKIDCNCWRYGRTATLVRWNSMARGRLAVMTSALMDERFKCPECGDTREVETGPDLASVSVSADSYVYHAADLAHSAGPLSPTT